MATLTHPARAFENRNYITAPDVFVNEPMIDWTNPENLRRMQAALDKVRTELGESLRTPILALGAWAQANRAQLEAARDRYDRAAERVAQHSSGPDEVR